MSAQMRFVVEGRPDSPDNQSRHDLSPGKLVTVKNLSPGAANSLEILWMPRGDMAAVVAMNSSSAPAEWSFRPDAGAVGTYRVRLTVDGQSLTRELAILTPNRQLRIPALCERGSAEASWVSKDTAAVKAASENNALYAGDPRVPGENYSGYYLDLEKLYLTVDELAGAVDALPSGGGSSSSSDDVSNASAVTGPNVTAALNTLNARPAGITNAINTSAVAGPWQASIISGKVGSDLVLKKLRALNNIGFTIDADEIQLSAKVSAARTIAATLTGPTDSSAQFGSGENFDDASAISLSAATPQNLLGMPSPSSDGRVRTYVLYNPGPAAITIKHNADMVHGAGFCLSTPGGVDYVFKPNAVALAIKADYFTPYVIRPLATAADLTVASVFGRTGAVVPAADDYLASQVKNDAGVAGATVAAALNTLNAKPIPSGSNDIANQSTVPSGGATVTTALNALQTALASAGGAGVAIVNQSGTAYTFALTDADKLVVSTNAALQTLTIPVGHPIGTVLSAMQEGAGQLQFTCAENINTPLSFKTRKQYSIIYATKIAAGQWRVSGDMA